MKLLKRKERSIKLIIRKLINNSKILLEEMVSVDKLTEDPLVTTTHTSQLDQTILDLVIKERRLEILNSAKKSAQKIQNVKHSISIYLTQEPTITVGYGQKMVMDQMVQTKHTVLLNKTRTLLKKVKMMVLMKI